MSNPDPISAPWWRKDAVIFAALLLIAALAFGTTYAVTKSYARREDALARRWSQAGETDLRAGRAKSAVEDFRTALLYSRDNPQFRLRLAQALAANNDIPQAIAYFLNLWEEQPGSGLYNLELARLYARDHQPRKADQYYNNAIYGAWPDDPGAKRRAARVEYIRFLMQQKQTAQAQAEAIALDSTTPPNDIAGHLLAANLLLTAGDPQHALEEYAALRRVAPGDAAFGVGEAAYELGQFRTAAEHLRTSIDRGIKDPAAPNMLNQAESVLDLDPWQRHISAAERAKRVATAFLQAGTRLQQCAAGERQSLNAVPPITDLQLLYAEWLKADSSIPNLARDPDLRDSVMDLAFRIENITSAHCGQPSQGPDWAIVMLSRYGEGVQR